MRLLPREEKFYPLFLKQVDIISEASRLLLEGLRAGNARLAGAATEINVLEHKGDEVIHELFTRLNSTFITPIDPEDIHALSSALDNVLDGVEDTAHRLVSYEIDPIPDTIEFPAPPPPERPHQRDQAAWDKYNSDAATYREEQTKEYKETEAKAEAVMLQNYLSQANHGDAQAQDELGDVYLFGYDGAEKDFAEAAKWYRKAADPGRATAAWRLSHLYSEGQGIPKDDKEAFKWMRLTADREDLCCLGARKELALMYLHGKGVEQNSQEAVYWMLLDFTIQHRSLRKSLEDEEDLLLAPRHVTDDQLKVEQGRVQEWLRAWEKAHPSPAPKK
jgi:hypothetical protein